MTNDFFNKPEEEITEPTTIKLGEDSYTQEELENLVGLGKIAKESERKYNKPINKFWPEYNRAQQEIVDLKQKLLDSTKPEPVMESPEPTNLTSEQKQLVREQLKDIFGDEPVTRKELDSFYSNRKNADKLISDTESVVQKAKADGLPETSLESLFTYMNETGVSKPEIAYKLMFETELDKIKQQKLSSLKQPGIVTMNSSTAGGKNLPTEKVKITRSNIHEVMRNFMKERANR